MKNPSFGIAFSAIAIETRYLHLLHLVKFTRAFSKTGNLIAELRKYYPSYEKAKQNHFAMLEFKLPAAYVNAKRLRKQSEPFKNVVDCNPWTDVGLLVKELTSAEIP